MSALTENLKPEEIEFLKFQKGRDVDSNTAFKKLELARSQGKFGTVESIEVTEEKPGFFGSVKQDLIERGGKVKEAFQQQQEDIPEIDTSTVGGALEAGARPLGTAVQVVGQGFGAAGDVIGEGLIAGLKGLGSLASAVTPDFIEDPIKEKVGAAGTAVLQSDTGQAGLKAISEGVEAYGEFKKENPQTAANLEAIGNIVSFTPIGKAGGTVTKTTAKQVGKAGEVIKESGIKSAAKKKKDFISDLISPKQTATQKAGDISKGKVKEGGLLSGRTKVLDKGEELIAKDVSKIPGVSAKKTQLENANIINNEIGKIANKLEADLAAKPVLIPKQQTKAVIDRAAKELADNPLLVGDAEKVAGKIVNKFSKLIDENPGNASGLLKSRKQLDAWVKSQKPKAFDGDKAGAFEIALKQIRTSTNDLLDSAVTNTKVKASLRNQSNLFRALDNLAPKAAKESPTKLGRVAQKLKDKVGISGEILTGAGLIGGTAFIPGFTTGLGILGTAIGVKKAIFSPKTRKFLGEALIQVDNLIQKAPNPDLQILKTEITDLLEEDKLKSNK